MAHRNLTTWHRPVAAAGFALLAGCGGGGGGSSGGVGPPQTFAVTGTASGLAGTLVLRNNGGDALTINTNGNFSFATPLAAGAAYNVTVANQPVLQTCTVAGQSGTANAGGTNLTVVCVNNAFDASLTLADIKTFRFSWTAVPGASHYRLLEDPDGMSGFTPVGGEIPVPLTGRDVYVPLYRRVNARYRVQVCDATHCVDSGTIQVTGALTHAIGYFKASNPGNSDSFGYRLAISADGDTLAVSSSGEDGNATLIDGDALNNLATDSGAVYLFSRGALGWVPQAYVKAPNTEAQDSFGAALALSDDGSTLVVGADREDGNATGVNGTIDNLAMNSGAVYVYGRTGATWHYQTYLKPSNTDVDDFFGYSVAVSGDGNTIAVGAPFEDSGSRGVGDDDDDESAAQGGALYVFQRSGTTWTQQAYVKASNTEAGDEFGKFLDLDRNGNTLVVAAPYEASGSGTINGDQSNNAVANAGATYVFTRTGTAWSQRAYIKPSNPGSGDFFGWGVALSADGTTLAVAALSEDSNATGINGNQSNNSAANSGAAYVFAQNGGTWSQQAYIKASNTRAHHWFASSIDLSADGNLLAIGALGDASNAIGFRGDETNDVASSSGAAFFFVRSAGNWSQTTYLKASNTEIADQFGHQIALSADGNTLAVGAYTEDSGAAGVRGDQANNSVDGSGAVYLY